MLHYSWSIIFFRQMMFAHVIAQLPFKKLLNWNRYKANIECLYVPHFEICVICVQVKERLIRQCLIYIHLRERVLKIRTNPCSLSKHQYTGSISPLSKSLKWNQFILSIKQYAGNMQSYLLFDFHSWPETSQIKDQNNF